MTTAPPRPKPQYAAAVYHVLVAVLGFVSLVAILLAQTREPKLWSVAVAAALWGLVFTRHAALSAAKGNGLSWVFWGLVGSAATPVQIVFCEVFRVETSLPKTAASSAITAACCWLWIYGAECRAKARGRE